MAEVPGQSGLQEIMPQKTKNREKNYPGEKELSTM